MAKQPATKPPPAQQQAGTSGNTVVIPHVTKTQVTQVWATLQKGYGYIPGQPNANCYLVALAIAPGTQAVHTALANYIGGLGVVGLQLAKPYTGNPCAHLGHKAASGYYQRIANAGRVPKLGNVPFSQVAPKCVVHGPTKGQPCNTTCQYGLFVVASGKYMHNLLSQGKGASKPSKASKATAKAATPAIVATPMASVAIGPSYGAPMVPPTPTPSS